MQPPKRRAGERRYDRQTHKGKKKEKGKKRVLGGARAIKHIKPYFLMLYTSIWIPCHSIGFAIYRRKAGELWFRPAEWVISITFFLSRSWLAFKSRHDFRFRAPSSASRRHPQKSFPKSPLCVRAAAFIISKRAGVSCRQLFYRRRRSPSVAAVIFPAAFSSSPAQREGGARK